MHLGKITYTYQFYKLKSSNSNMVSVILRKMASNKSNVIPKLKLWSARERHTFRPLIVGFHRCCEHWGALLTPLGEFPRNLMGGWGGGGLSQNMGGASGELKMLSKKYLWGSSFDKKVASYKPVSLQIY